MIVELPRYSYFNKKYPIKIILKNVSENPIYDLFNEIDRIDEISHSEFKITRDGETKFLDRDTDLLLSEQNVAGIHVKELLPGEEATIELRIPDLWKSVYEQYIDAEIFDANQARIMAALLNDPNLNQINFVNAMYAHYFSELPREHILKDFVKCRFWGSNSDIDCEVKIIEPQGNSNDSSVHMGIWLYFQ